MRHLMASVLMVFVLLASSTGRADDDEAAKIQFSEAIKLYEAGKFEQAAILFERAYELKPSFKILYNIAQAENEMGHYASALMAYTSYLAEGGDQIDAERIAEVQKETKRLNALVGMIVVECPVVGAKVKINDEVKGKTPMAGPIFVDVGKHEVVVKKGQEELLSEVVKVAGGERISVVVEAKAWAGEAAEEDEVGGEDGDGSEVAPQPVGTGDGEGGKILPWVLVGAGAAAAVAGGVMGGVALSKRNDLKDSCPNGECPEGVSLQSDRDSVKGLALGADILYGVAAAGVVAGVVILLVGGGDEDAALEVAPVASAGGAWMTVSGRF